MQKIALIGANGQLGSDLVEAFASRNEELIKLTHANIEITDHTQTRQKLTNLAPSVVINTAAYHRVDEMEENIIRAFDINAAAVRNLAQICRDLDATLVHLSTDYVFGGDLSRNTPCPETTPPFPINVYGVSKLAGEYSVRSITPKHYVVRVSGLYGVAGSSGKGGNFVELMLRLAHEGKPIKVVNDQRLTPTSTHDLAQKIIELLDSGAYGLYHMTSTGDCTWYEFAGKIFELCGLSPDLSPTATGSFGEKATRPAYSVLDNAALRSTGLTDMRHWHEALRDYLIKKGHIAQP